MSVAEAAPRILTREELRIAEEHPAVPEGLSPKLQRTNESIIARLKDNQGYDERIDGIYSGRRYEKTGHNKLVKALGRAEIAIALGKSDRFNRKHMPAIHEQALIDDAERHAGEQKAA